MRVIKKERKGREVEKYAERKDTWEMQRKEGKGETEKRRRNERNGKRERK